MQWLKGDLTFELLARMLDVCLLRHRVIATNIANVDTPGFKTRRVIFEEKLRNLLNQNLTREKLQKLTPEIRIDYTSNLREDLNNVNIEKEIVKLSMNTLRYNLYVQLLNKKLEKLKMAIRGR